MVVLDGSVPTPLISSSLVMWLSRSTFSIFFSGEIQWECNEIKGVRPCTAAVCTFRLLHFILPSFCKHWTRQGVPLRATSFAPRPTRSSERFYFEQTSFQKQVGATAIFVFFCCFQATQYASLSLPRKSESSSFLTASLFRAGRNRCHFFIFIFLFHGEFLLMKSLFFSRLPFLYGESLLRLFQEQASCETSEHLDVSGGFLGGVWGF